ncbi:MAG: hypothetical protein HKN16_08575, partial [Saprospiraceae bacterium]|nr:hypothetical protein [Saprospiraceae bacterium]
MISMLMFKVFLVCFTLNSCQTANEKRAEPTIVPSVEQEVIADSSPVVTDPIEATLSAKPENPIKEVIPPTDNSDSQRPNTKDPGSDLPITPGIEDTSNPENQEAKE